MIADIGTCHGQAKAGGGETAALEAVRHVDDEAGETGLCRVAGEPAKPMPVVVKLAAHAAVERMAQLG